MWRRCLGIAACLAACLTVGPLAAQTLTADDPLASSDRPALDGAPFLDGPSARPAAIGGPGAPDAAPLLLAVLDAEASFARYSTELGDAGLDALDRLLAQLGPLEELLSIRVTGHADSRGGDADNLLLSRERAESVADVLRERFPGTRVMATGLGEAQPIADNATAEGRALNRRVEIQVLALGRRPSPGAAATDAPDDRTAGTDG